MYIYIYTHICVCVCVCVCVYTLNSKPICVSVSVYAYVYAYVHVYLCVYTDVLATHCTGRSSAYASGSDAPTSTDDMGFVASFRLRLQGEESAHICSGALIRYTCT